MSSITSSSAGPYQKPCWMESSCVGRVHLKEKPACFVFARNPTTLHGPVPSLQQIDEALLHLTKAVSIDPENAKYLHTLGLAKRVTGDEAGAREDFFEAELLDEQDAEDRYQLRMQRIERSRTARDSETELQEVFLF